MGVKAVAELGQTARVALGDSSHVAQFCVMVLVAGVVILGVAWGISWADDIRRWLFSR
jgi:hypothetical protein